MERIDHVVEAEDLGGCDEFVPADTTGVEKTAGIEEPAAPKGALPIGVCQVVADMGTERHRQISKGDGLMALCGDL